MRAGFPVPLRPETDARPRQREDRRVGELFRIAEGVDQGRRILINDKPVFQRLILDQGFYPDGIWTAPTDEALRHDIEMSMAAGYNGTRLHQQVFEPRFLYWADKLGYIVWGEFPGWGYGFKPEGYAPFVAEWTEVLLRDRNHPAIIGWCPFNETGGHKNGSEIQQVIWNVTKAVDPTRPALETSGHGHTLPHTEIRDYHDYDGNPAQLRKRWADYFTAATAPIMPARYGPQANSVPDCGVPFMISELGGIGWATEGGWGYGARPKSLDEFYSRYQGTLDAVLDNPNLFGFCYTQLTDVEQEHNWLYYYDRRPKFDLKRICQITSRRAAYERSEPTAPPRTFREEVPWKVLVGAQQDGALSTPWRYVTTTPQGDWTAERFDDNAWRSGRAPFGRDEANWKARTPWTTSDIYLRKTFEYDGDDGAKLKLGAVVIAYYEDTEAYLNGKSIRVVKNLTGRCEMHVVTEALRAALRKGANTVAVHTRQTVSGQHIDLAILVQ